DEAAAMVRLKAHTEPNRVKELEEALAEHEKEKQAAVAAEKYEEAARLKQRIDEVRGELETLRTQWQERKGVTEPAVTPESIAAVVSEWTGIPASRLEAE